MAETLAGLTRVAQSAAVLDSETLAELERWQEKARALQAELALLGVQMTWSIELSFPITVKACPRGCGGRLVASVCGGRDCDHCGHHDG